MDLLLQNNAIQSQKRGSHLPKASKQDVLGTTRKNGGGVHKRHVVSQIPQRYGSRGPPNAPSE